MNFTTAMACPGKDCILLLCRLHLSTLSSLLAITVHIGFVFRNGKDLNLGQEIRGLFLLQCDHKSSIHFPIST